MRRSDGSPLEVSRGRYDVQILDKETLFIQETDWQKIQEMVWRIFKERRPVSFGFKQKSFFGGAT